MNTTLTTLPLEPSREGWVYLLHAEGTDRYKIGRSANPITRCANIQKQSPYPLKILKDFWSIDAVSDEAHYHAYCSECRVFGEWFQLGKITMAETPDLTEKESVEKAFYFRSKVIEDIAFKRMKWLVRQIHLDRNSNIFYLIFRLYNRLQSRQEFEDLENFIRWTLLDVVCQDACLEYFEKSSEGLTDKGAQSLNDFLCGSLLTFAKFTLTGSRKL